MWRDRRLAFINANVSSMTFNAKSIERVWVPDIHFPNEKSGSFHYVTVQNKLMHVKKDGSVKYSQRYVM